MVIEVYLPIFYSVKRVHDLVSRTEITVKTGNLQPFLEVDEECFESIIKPTQSFQASYQLR